MTNVKTQQSGRREFLKTAGAGLAAAATPGVMVHAASLASEPVDVMVVGSGFGGAVTALRLVQQGLRVLMLERGRRWPVKDHYTFSNMSNPDGRACWLRDSTFLGSTPYSIDRYIGVLELIPGNGMSIIAGAGLGGGSLVYNGVTYLPHAAMFRKAFGTQVDYEEMRQVYYPRAKAMLQAAPIPAWMLERPEYAAAKEWAKLGLRAGLPTRLVDCALDWNVVADELRGTNVPSVIAGEFWYGNNSGAKRSLDKNYLLQAERTGRLEILTQHQVSGVAEGPEGRYVVSAEQIDSNGSVIGRRQFVVKKLFMSGGSAGTSMMMTRAKGRGSLPRLNEHVGRHWGSNGDFFSAISGLHRYVDPVQCGTAPVAIEHLDNPVAPTMLVCFADYFSKGQAGKVSSIGMTLGPPKGYFSYDPATDKVSLNWPTSDPDVARITTAAEYTYEYLAKAYGSGVRFEAARAGSLHIHHRHPGQTNPVGASTSSHPVGGMVLGLATDNIGTVRNYPGLYVVDGSLVPGNAGCTNPSFTIAALAERNIERIIRRDFA